MLATKQTLKRLLISWLMKNITYLLYVLFLSTLRVLILNEIAVDTYVNISFAT